MQQMVSGRSITRRIATWALCVAVLGLVPVADAAAQNGVATSGEAPIVIDLRARTFQPGEAVVVTLTVPPPAVDVRVRVFDRTVAAFPLEGGQWRALVGIDLDQRAGAYALEAQAIEGQHVRTATRRLTVQRRTFPTRVLQVAPDFVNPPKDVQARIDADRQFTQAVYSQSATTRLWTSPFVRPVPQAANSRFGTRSVFNGERRSPHAGTDFLSPTGTPIHAPNAGRVVAARDLYFTGNTVIIDHGLGVFSLFAHLSKLDATEGQSVAPGDVVGLVGATGRVTGPHLHWAMAVAGARVDPLSLLALLGRP